MMKCHFERLVLYLDKRLSVDAQLEVLEHLDTCENCFDAVYHISRDRDAGLFVHRRYELEQVLAR